MIPCFNRLVRVGSIVFAGTTVQWASATFVIHSNFSTWQNQSGGVPVYATLLDHLPPGFQTQRIPDDIFADVGITLSSSTQLIAHPAPPGGSWYISTDTPGTHIDIHFSTPSTAVWVYGGVMLNGEFQPFAGRMEFYSGETFLGWTFLGSAGAISSIPIDRVVIVGTQPEHVPEMGGVYWVPAPGGVALLVLAQMARQRRRR